MNHLLTFFACAFLFSTTTSQTYTIGLNNDLGGYVLYVTPDGQSGVTVTTQDQNTSNWYGAPDQVSDPANHNDAGKQFTDWRVPTPYELELIYKAKDQIGGFDYDFYWSSIAENEQNGLGLNFKNGYREGSQKSSSRHGSIGIRAVRSWGPITSSRTSSSNQSSSPSSVAAKYKVGDHAEGGIVISVDETGEHGLVCAKNDQAYAATWEEANQACSNYVMWGQDVTYNNWRLPTIDEMQMIVDHKETIDATAQTINGVELDKHMGAYYWTTTENEQGMTGIISLGWMGGYTTYSAKGSTFLARAVREF